jgi:hypothetical protein
MHKGLNSEQKALINKLNYMHFTGDLIFVCLRHPRYEERILVKATGRRLPAGGRMAISQD